MLLVFESQDFRYWKIEKVPLCSNASILSWFSFSLRIPTVLKLVMWTSEIMDVTFFKCFSFSSLLYKPTGLNIFQVLKSFHDRERLFITDRFHKTYTKQAKQNLLNEIKRLEDRSIPLVNIWKFKCCDGYTRSNTKKTKWSSYSLGFRNETHNLYLFRYFTSVTSRLRL